MQNFSGWIAEEWTASEKVARRRAAGLGGLLGGIVAAVGVFSLWGFCVDDAWIIARVADNLAEGGGHRFNLEGPVVDAVTPFGFAHLLAAFGGDGPLGAFRVARHLGAAALIGAGVLLGIRIGYAGKSRARFWVLAWLCASIGIPAWAVSGMETALIMLAVVAGCGARIGQTALLGFAAAWRPELLPFALATAVGAGWAGGNGVRGALIRACVCLAPTVAMIALRMHHFGATTPLAFVAKPSDLEHGLRYAIGGGVFTGALPLLAGSLRWSGLTVMGRTRLVALLAHVAALSFAGGDWMPLYRLWCPVLPVALLLAAESLEQCGRWRGVGAVAAGVACLSVPAAVHFQDARAVLDRRLQLVAGAAPLLEGAQRVVSLDVGWVGLTTRAPVVDLAGVTDPDVAYLAGGHTSKRIAPDFARRRAVDAAVVLAPPGQKPAIGDQARVGMGSRAVEARLLHQLGELGFRSVGLVPLGGTTQSYVVLRRDAQAK